LSTRELGSDISKKLSTKSLIDRPLAAWYKLPKGVVFHARNIFYTRPLVINMRREL